MTRVPEPSGFFSLRSSHPFGFRYTSPSGPLRGVYGREGKETTKEARSFLSSSLHPRAAVNSPHHSLRSFFTSFPLPSGPASPEVRR